jgi:glycosyltransferase involved in cell wall biosynthesis
MQQALAGFKVCWISGTRHSEPLNETMDKKWRSLVGLGCDIFVISLASDWHPHYFTQSAHFYLLPELPISVLRYLEIAIISPLLALWLVLRQNVQVLVTQSPYEGAIGAMVKNAARLFGRRVVLIVENHGDFEVSVFTQRRIVFTSVYRWFMHHTARYALGHADVLRAVSNSTRQQLTSRAPGKPIEQFLTWTDSSVFADSVREKPLSETQNFVYAGVLIPRKGVHFLIEAFGQIALQFPNSHLYLVGKGENGEYTRQIIARIAALNLNERVTCIGTATQTELAHFMGRARALVLPSVSEGLPRVVVEAMLCGTPAIASRVDGIPEVIEDGMNGLLVPPGDIEALAAALVHVLCDPEIEVMGIRARDFARSFFSQDHYVAGYRRLFETALNYVR